MSPHDAKVDLSDKVNVYAITPDLLNSIQTEPSAATPNPDLDKAMSSYEYVVGPGDILSVTVWEHPELSTMGTIRAALPSSASGGSSSGGSASLPPPAASGGQGNVVGADGTIYFPYVGSLKVQGMRLADIRTALTKGLAHYLMTPQVDVAVSQFRAQRVYIAGEVRQPGPVSVTDVPLTLLDAVNQAGGLLPTSDWNRVTLTRQGQETSYSLSKLYRFGDTRQNVMLQGGDLVFIPRSDSNKVFVLGEVKLAHSVSMTLNGLTLAEALSEAGGINEYSSDASGVFVLRRSKDKQSGKLIDVYQLNIKDATSLVLAESFPLQERDIVYVTAAPLTRWNKVINLLLPSLNGLYVNTQTQHLLQSQ
jgi:polysaccharide export outer membrane protein